SKLLQVVALDSQGSPVANVNVTFTAPASGASGTFTDSGTNITLALTDESGVATTSIFIANALPGTYIAIASASGAGSASFSLQNTLWHVAPTGNDSNSCLLPVSPCATINGALNKAVAGDTILVAAGTYTGSGNEVVLIDKSITLSGGWDASFTMQNGTSFIDGQGARIGVLATNAVSAVIDHFTIQNGNYIYGGGVKNSGGTLIIND